MRRNFLLLNNIKKIQEVSCVTVIENYRSIRPNQRAMQSAIKTDSFESIALGVGNLPDAQLRVRQAKRTFQGFPFMSIEAHDRLRSAS